MPRYFSGMGFRIHTWKLRNMHESSSLDIKLCITKYFSVGCSESTLFLPSVQLSESGVQESCTFHHQNQVLQMFAAVLLGGFLVTTGS